MSEISDSELQDFVNRVCASINPRFDRTYATFPKDRRDICGVKRVPQNELKTRCYDMLYLIWKNREGELDYKTVVDSNKTKDQYLWINQINVEGDEVMVKISGGSSWSGAYWERTHKEDKKSMNLD